jgi:hypothetical protein
MAHARYTLDASVHDMTDLVAAQPDQAALFDRRSRLLERLVSESASVPERYRARRPLPPQPPRARPARRHPRVRSGNTSRPRRRSSTECGGSVAVGQTRAALRGGGFGHRLHFAQDFAQRGSRHDQETEDGAARLIVGAPPDARDDVRSFVTGMAYGTNSTGGGM